jgi:hypothetical protein
MAKRADPSRRVIGAARFSEPGLREKLAACGVDCIAADLLSRDALAQLPDAANIVFMAGRKFGSTGSEWLTWAMNCSQAVRLFGPPRVPLERMLDWTADWVQRGGASLGKPTHYEARDGKY